MINIFLEILKSYTGCDDKKPWPQLRAVNVEPDLVVATNGKSLFMIERAGIGTDVQMHLLCNGLNVTTNTFLWYHTDNRAAYEQYAPYRECIPKFGKNEQGLKPTFSFQSLNLVRDTYQLLSTIWPETFTGLKCFVPDRWNGLRYSAVKIFKNDEYKITILLTPLGRGYYENTENILH